jgi:peroxiredoxin Q/BCP
MFSWLFSDPLPVGSIAPDFNLPDDAGNTVSLSSLRASNVLLVFYPGDDTPGCKRQLSQMRDNWDRLRSAGVLVFGVNPQGAQSHTSFRKKYNFPFPLLIDKGQQVGKLYHANGLIVKRTVYLIGKDGKVQFGRRGMPSPDEVLASLK